MCCLYCIIKLINIKPKVNYRDHLAKPTNLKKDKHKQAEINDLAKDLHLFKNHAELLS